MQPAVLQQPPVAHRTHRSPAAASAAAGRHPCPSLTRLTKRSVAAAAAGPFAAAPEPLLPLSNIADMRRQASTDLDDYFAASPFSTIRRLDDMWEQQFQAMDPFSGSSSLRSMEGSMRQQMQDMDRQFDRAFGDLDRMQRELDQELQRGLRQLQEQQPGVRIERREEKSPQSYRYYQSIQISSGTSFTALAPAHTTFFNPLLFAAVVLAGAWAAVTAAFARNYDLTLYQERSKWKLLLLWPVLVLFSKQFRQHFSSALRGEQVRVQEDDTAEGGGSSSS